VLDATTPALACKQQPAAAMPHTEDSLLSLATDVANLAPALCHLAQRASFSQLAVPSSVIGPRHGTAQQLAPLGIQTVLQLTDLLAQAASKPPNAAATEECADTTAPLAAADAAQPQREVSTGATSCRPGKPAPLLSRFPLQPQIMAMPEPPSARIAGLVLAPPKPGPAQRMLGGAAVDSKPPQAASAAACAVPLLNTARVAAQEEPVATMVTPRLEAKPGRLMAPPARSPLTDTSCDTQRSTPGGAMSTSVEISPDSDVGRSGGEEAADPQDTWLRPWEMTTEVEETIQAIAYQPSLFRLRETLTRELEAAAAVVGDGDAASRAEYARCVRSIRQLVVTAAAYRRAGFLNA
jgi:hypothetical protein